MKLYSIFTFSILLLYACSSPSGKQALEEKYPDTGEHIKFTNIDTYNQRTDSMHTHFFSIHVENFTPNEENWAKIHSTARLTYTKPQSRSHVMFFDNNRSVPIKKETGALGCVNTVYGSDFKNGIIAHFSRTPDGTENFTKGPRNISVEPMTPKE